MSKSKKYYGANILGFTNSIVQVDPVLNGAYSIQIDEEILKLAHEEYKAQNHTQTFEQIQARGGFGVFEIITLLADHVERLKNVK